MPNAQTDAPERGETPEMWLSASEVAAILKVSERTVRRRCESGQLASRRVATSSGVLWQIDPLGVRTVRPSAATQNEAGTQNTLLSADKVRTGADTLTTHLLEENRRLWAALEAAQQSEAVTKAALRELLKAQPKQLAAGESSTMNQTARNAPERAPNIEVGSYGGAAPNGAETGGKPLTIGDIADMLEAREREMNR
jgi:hypothetical protein